MAISNPLHLVRLAAASMLLFVPSNPAAEQRPPVAEQIANTYGLESFAQIEGIRYTWNADLPGARISNTWEWNPKTNAVTFEGKDKDGKPVKVSYQRSQIGTQSDTVKNQIDPRFINDQYWLLFPFHVIWDGSATVTDEGMRKLPAGNGSARRLVVKYPAESGGYTPGDTWELYVGTDKRVEQFIYRRGGSVKPGIVIAKWTDYKKAGPLLVAMDHRGTADGKPLRVWFTNVSVKMAGSPTWVTAQ